MIGVGGCWCPDLAGTVEKPHRHATLGVISAILSPIAVTVDENSSTGSRCGRRVVDRQAGKGGHAIDGGGRVIGKHRTAQTRLRDRYDFGKVQIGIGKSVARGNYGVGGKIRRYARGETGRRWDGRPA